MEFKDRLIELRKSSGWSQEELGDKLEVTRQTVSKWELGQTTPEMNKLTAISELFHISLDELVSGKEPGREQEGAVKREVIYIEQRRHFEYKSKKAIHGLPLIHINLGFGVCRAKGVIAVGNIATGLLAVGGIAIGAVSIGGFALGLLAVAAFAMGIFSAGGIAAGFIALGGMAFGYLAIGGMAVGVYSLGGSAIAQRVAAGGYANAYIAVGDSVNGVLEFFIKDGVPDFNAEAFRQAVIEKYPDTWKWILDLFMLLLK